MWYLYINKNFIIFGDIIRQLTQWLYSWDLFESLFGQIVNIFKTQNQDFGSSKKTKMIKL
jgi:hypothetical protein